jgi:hypothetical protein
MPSIRKVCVGGRKKKSKEAAHKIATYSDVQIPAWEADQTTSTRKTIPAVVELTPVHTNRIVDPMAVSVAMNQ